MFTPSEVVLANWQLAKFSDRFLPLLIDLEIMIQEIRRKRSILHLPPFPRTEAVLEPPIDHHKQRPDQRIGQGVEDEEGDGQSDVHREAHREQREDLPGDGEEGEEPAGC